MVLKLFTDCSSWSITFSVGSISPLSSAEVSGKASASSLMTTLPGNDTEIVSDRSMLVVVVVVCSVIGSALSEITTSHLKDTILIDTRIFIEI